MLCLRSCMLLTIDDGTISLPDTLQPARFFIPYKEVAVVAA